MPAWLKNLILLILPEILKNLFAKPSACPTNEKKDGDKEKK